jgi:hypothetical protein
MTDRISELIALIGGEDERILVVESAGIVGVRFKNSYGLMETRWGTSIVDLRIRLERLAKKHGVQI